MTAGVGGGFAVLAGVCGAVAAAGILLIAAGLRRVPVQPGRSRGRPGDVLRGRPRAAAGAALLGKGLPPRRLLGAVTAGVLAWSVTGWPVAAAAAAAAVLGVPRLLSQSAGRRQAERLEALEAWTRRLADLLGSGAGGLEQAIAASVRTCPPPIAAEVTALAGRLRLRGPEAALRMFADDLADTGSGAADLVSAALILRVRRGGRGLRPVLEALAADVSDLVRDRRAVEADRAKPRQNVRVLLAITALVVTAMLVFARDFLSPFSSPVGQLALAVIAAVFGCGIVLLARISRLPDPPRFLPPAANSTYAAAPAFRAAASRAAGAPAKGTWWG